MLTVATDTCRCKPERRLQCSLRKGKVAADNNQNTPVHFKMVHKTGKAVKPLY